ncbi:MAG: hypothetical protein O7F12_07865 [Nitrospirae bacterium]|nr:hypothetical protein [Nitrospirota bacterium]
MRAGTEADQGNPWNEEHTVPQAFGLQTDSDTLGLDIQNCTVRSTFPQVYRNHEPRKVDLQGLDFQACRVHGY